MPAYVKVLTVADLHQGERLFGLLGEAVLTHRPDVVALVGDFLDATGDDAGKLPIPECARILGNLPCKEMLFIRGNHENELWWAFAQEWEKTGRQLHAVHGEAFVCGPLVVIGFPCTMGDDVAFAGERASLSGDCSRWLTKIIKRHRAASRTLWLMHEPPLGTPLSQPNSPVEGVQEWLDAIERYSPLLVICGHDHETPLIKKCWHCRLGLTTVVNVGQNPKGPLHYCNVEVDCVGAKPGLPRQIKVTAYPWGESIVLRGSDNLHL